MINLPINSHKFKKASLYTQFSRGRSFDKYIYEVCGLDGRRYGLSDKITVSRNKVSCSFYKNNSLNYLNKKIKVLGQIYRNLVFLLEKFTRL